MNTNAIEIRGLTKSFSKFHLGPLELTVPRGAIYGFIGPNGSGKTTTIDLMLGMGRNDGGNITVLGKDHERDAAAVKQQIGYVSPELNFQAWGKVRKAIQFVRGFYPTWDDAYCQQLMQKFQLAPDAPILTLSFGAKIKLALVMALSHRPALLILDEPTVGLDAVSKNQVFAELLTLVEDGNHTVFISSHGLSDIERFADHVGMIKDGRILFEGSTDEVVGRFRMADYESELPTPTKSASGFFVVATDGGRCRALIDLELWTPEKARKQGLRELSTAPVTLEEVFVSLAKI